MPRHRGRDRHENDEGLHYELGQARRRMTTSFRDRPRLDLPRIIGARSIEGSVTISVLKQILDRHKWRLRWKTLKRLDLKSIPMQHQLMVVLRRARFAIRLGPSHDKSLSFYEQ